MDKERKEDLRNESIQCRKDHTLDLLGCALATENPILCHDFIKAARAIWGIDYDPEFLELSESAIDHMRNLYRIENGAQREV